MEKTDIKGTPVQGFFELSLAKQLTLLIGISASIALGFYVVLWAKKPDFVPIFSQISLQETGEVIETLQRENIKFQLDGGSGLVLVDASKLHEARIKLASNGITNGLGTGFELLDKDTGIGTSQFMERTRYIRGLQGELERTITSIQKIKSARVHLAIPKQTAFLKDKKEPSASVFVDIYGGYSLGSEQVAAISSLVASSIQGLSSSMVTVIDQNGNLLSTEGADNLAKASKQIDYIKKVEDIYSQRVTDILTPIIGPGRVKAEVTAVVDFTSFEETSENFDPKRTVVRSEKALNVKNSQDGATYGVPGALSNQPPAPGKAETVNDSEETENAQQLAATANMRKQYTKNYEIDRSIKHQSSLPGKLLRLSVAVVVDHKVTYDSSGKENRTAFTEEEITNIKKIVQDAVGYDQQRGDTVSVINSPFAQTGPIEELAPPGIMEQPWFTTIVKQVLTAIVVLAIIFIVLRPLVKNLTNIASFKNKVAVEEQKRAIEMQNMQAAETQTQSGQNMQRVSNLINNDPKKAAQVIKQWVSVENE